MFTCKMALEIECYFYYEYRDIKSRRKIVEKNENNA